MYFSNSLHLSVIKENSSTFVGGRSDSDYCEYAETQPADKLCIMNTHESGGHNNDVSGINMDCSIKCVWE